MITRKKKLKEFLQYFRGYIFRVGPGFTLWFSWIFFATAVVLFHLIVPLPIKDNLTHAWMATVMIVIFFGLCYITIRHFASPANTRHTEKKKEGDS